MGSERGFMIQAEPFASCVSKGRILHHSELSFCNNQDRTRAYCKGFLQRFSEMLLFICSAVSSLCNPKDCIIRPASSPFPPSLPKFLSIEL